MNMLKCCLNPKVIAGVAVVGAGLVLFAPNLLAGGLPLLIGLICPLSMLLMLGSMGKMGGAPAQTQVAPTAAGAGGYVCPMHSDVRSDQPGRCSRCGMALVATAPQTPPSVLVDEPGTTPVSREARLGLLRAQLHVLGEQQAALAARVDQLQAAEPSADPPGKALEEAEQIVEAAGRRT